MRLPEIIELMHPYSSPYDFAHTVEDAFLKFIQKTYPPGEQERLYNYKLVRSLFPPQEQVIIEKSIQQQLEHALQNALKNTSLVRNTSKKKYNAYVKEYRASIKNASVTSPSEITAAAKNAELVYIGDYHPIETTKIALQDLLAGISTAVELTIFLESVQQKYQPELEAYLHGKRDNLEDHMLIHAWPVHQTILSYLRKNHPRIQTHALRPDDLSDQNIYTTATLMAQTIARFVGIGKKVIVFAGDYHVAHTHLPRLVKELVGSQTNDIIIHQNVTGLYWKLREQYGEHVPPVKISGQEYCIFNTSPLVKRQAWLDTIINDEFVFEELTPEEKVRKTLTLVYVLYLLDHPGLKKAVTE